MNKRQRKKAAKRRAEKETQYQIDVYKTILEKSGEFMVSLNNLVERMINALIDIMASDEFATVLQAMKKTIEEKQNEKQG